MNTILLLILTSMSSIIILFKLGSLGLLETSEARYAEIAYEMAKSGDWLTPRIWNITDFQKPPFVYWATALSYKVFGFSEFAARFPAALCAIFGILICYFLGKTLFNKKVGFYAALLLLASPLYLGASKILNLDIFVSLCVSLMFLMFLKNRYFSFYALMGISILVKGPMALFYIIPTLLIFLAIQRDMSKLKNMHLIKGIFICLLISLPWFVWESIHYKDLWKFFVYGQLGSRFLPFIKAFESYKSIIPLPTKPFYYYGLIFIPAFLPSVICLLALIKTGIKSGGEDARAIKFLLCWLIVPFILLSILSVKQPLYLLSLAMPLALLSANILHRLVESIPSSRRIVRFTFLTFFALVFIAHFFIPRYEHHTKSVKAFLPMLYAHPDTQIVLYRALLRAIPFYTNKRPIFIHTQDPVGSKHFDLTFDDPKNYSPYFLLNYHNMDSLMEILASPAKTFAFIGYEWKDVLNVATSKKLPLFVCHQTPKYTLISNFNCLGN